MPGGDGGLAGLLLSLNEEPFRRMGALSTRTSKARSRPICPPSRCASAPMPTARGGLAAVVGDEVHAVGPRPPVCARKGPRARRPSC
jgi:hypothetical protein